MGDSRLAHIFPPRCPLFANACSPSCTLRRSPPGVGLAVFAYRDLLRFEPRPEIRDPVERHAVRAGRHHPRRDRRARALAGLAPPRALARAREPRAARSRSASRCWRCGAAILVWSRLTGADDLLALSAIASGLGLASLAKGVPGVRLLWLPGALPAVRAAAAARVRECADLPLPALDGGARRPAAVPVRHPRPRRRGDDSALRLHVPRDRGLQRAALGADAQHARGADGRSVPTSRLARVARRARGALRRVRPQRRARGRADPESALGDRCRARRAGRGDPALRAARALRARRRARALFRRAARGRAGRRAGSRAAFAARAGDSRSGSSGCSRSPPSAWRAGS